jgi:hypothetical protein
MVRVKLVLRLVEDQPEQALLVAQRLKGVAVVIEQLVVATLSLSRWERERSLIVFATCSEVH